MYTKYSVKHYKRKKIKIKRSKKMIYLKKKTCRPKLPEKKVRWHADSWRPLKFLHKKEKILIPLPRAEIAYLRPPRSHRSPLTQSSSSFPHPQRSCSPSRHPSEMTIIITSALRKWLTDHGLQCFIQVAEAPPQPNALKMASKLVKNQERWFCAAE